MSSEHTKRNTLIGGGMVLLQTLFWGIGNPLLKYALSVMPLYWCLTLRFLPTALLTYIIFRPDMKVLFEHKKLFRRTVGLSIVTAAAYILANLGLKYTSATTAGFLMSIAVLFTPFVAWLMYRKPIKAFSLIPIGIVTVGMFLISFDGSGISLGWGEFFAALSSVASAMQYAMSVETLEEVPPISLTVFQTGFVGLVTLTLALCTENASALTAAPMNSYLVIVYLVIFATLIAYILQNYALQRISAVYASLMYCVEPVFTAAASYVVLHEVLTVPGWIGAILILGSAVLATWKSDERNG